MTELERIHLFEAAGIDKIISDDFKNYLVTYGFFCAPASTKFHGAYEGGLFDHSLMVMNTLVDLSAKNGLKWQRAESPFIVGMFHDLCKIDQYRHPITAKIYDGDKECPVYDEGAWKYNPDTFVKGHGNKSVILLSQHLTLTEEEVMCILYHMGAFTEKEHWGEFTNAVNRFPNVLWTHHADMIASQVVGV